MTPPIPRRVLDSVMSKVNVNDPMSCWPTRLSLGSHGYGQVGWQDGDTNFMTTLQRVVWTATWGPIPKGYEPDHRCGYKPCGNPHHLRLLSKADNVRDGMRRASAIWKKRGYRYAK